MPYNIKWPFNVTQVLRLLFKTPWVFLLESNLNVNRRLGNKILPDSIRNLK